MGTLLQALFPTIFYQTGKDSFGWVDSLLQEISTAPQRLLLRDVYQTPLPVYLCQNPEFLLNPDTGFCCATKCTYYVSEAVVLACGGGVFPV